MKKDRIGIVIVNYNGAAYQNDALRTIFESDYSNVDVIIVDSGSSDNSIQLARDLYPDIYYLMQGENVGVAKGNNIGIDYAINELKDEYVLLLNNDVELASNTISELLKHASNECVTVPKIYYYEPSNMIWFAGGEMRWDRGESRHIGNFKIDDGSYDEVKKIDYAPTCCMLIHRDVIARVGYEDEAVFMYFDDTDMCVRIIEAGIEIRYVPTAEMWHKVSSSSGGMDSRVYVYYMTRNKLYFMNKHRDKLKLSARCYTYIKMAAKYILSPVYKKNDRYILTAMRDYRIGKMGRWEQNC